MTQDLPIVRLRPKADARALRWGAPWVYANDLVTDRRTKALAAGSLAVLEDANKTSLGVVAINPASKLMARMLDRDPQACIEQSWISTRLSQALTMRECLYYEPYYRLVHAEADGFPGVVIDRFGEVAVFQPNAAWADKLSELFVNALIEIDGIKTVVKNGTGRARALEGLPEETTLLRGELSAPIPVPMNGAIYMADLLEGQKTGLFFDQRENHAFAARLAAGARVLDVFSHVGGFALAALAGGASSALAVDGSASALVLAEKGAEAMGAAARFSTRRGDAFDVLSALTAEKAQFDIVVCDPPAFAPSKPALEAGLRAYEKVARLAAHLVRPGGYLGLCSCSHAADLQKFRQASIRGIGRAGRAAQLIYTGFAGPDHPQHPYLAESGYLKSVFFRLA